MEIKHSTAQVMEDQIARDAVVTLLQHIGEDVTREGLVKTPSRVVKALKEMTVGYGQSPEQILSTTFSSSYDQLVVLEGIEFVSLCEHHMLPFTGVATVGYIPDQRVVGLSKLARLVECYGRRLQIQEQMTNQIVEALDGYLRPKGAGVIIKAHHSCMSCRGVGQKNTTMVTSALRGVLLTEPSAKSEFLKFCG